MHGFVVLFALLFACASGKADEFADVDPKRLAKGVEILAAKWTIPIEVFYGATDDFAKANDEDVAATLAPEPVFPDVSNALWHAWACQPNTVRHAGRPRYGFVTDCLPGAITRRRD